MSHLRIGNGNDAGVLFIAVPVVLYGVDLGVVGRDIGHVFPSR